MSEVYEANVNAMHREAEWKAERRETAARINNDIQAVMAAAEEVFAAWARDDLLDRRNIVPVYDHSVGRRVDVALPNRSAMEASARFASAIGEVMRESLSLVAQEAMEEAQ
jgi:hypothetical protein